MSNSNDPQALVAEAEAAGEALTRVRAEIGKAIFGQERVIELTLAAVLAGGHVLLVGAGAWVGLGPRPIHAGPDACGYSGLGSSGSG
jgi:hypothetical protein